MTNNETAHTLNDLVAIARDGQEFYSEAAQKVEDQELSTLFNRIASVKGKIVSELAGAVQAAGGKPDMDGTMVGSMQKMYGTIRAALGDTQYGYVAQLEESEDRLLHAFEDTVGDSDTPTEAREIAAQLLPEVRQCHDTMRDRKHAMQNAS